MDWLNHLAPWHWLVLALVLLGAETLGTGGFLLGGVAAAALLALALWLVPDMSWAGQFILFAVATVLFSVLYWKVFRRYNQKTEQPQLNDRAAQLVGRRIPLDVDLPAGESRLQIGDTLWRVRCDQGAKAGDTLVITGSEGMLLLASKE